MKKLIYIIFLFPISLFAQMQVDISNNTNFSPQVLVEDTLVTGCLQAFNVVFDGNPESIGYYSNGGVIGSPSGIIISTGNVLNASQGTSDPDPTYETNHPGVAGDLLDMAQENAGTSSVQDVTILEFDFIPASDTVTFKYTFASEEFPNFNCSVYNDVFAFFVNGPGIDGPYADNAINIALVPGTDPPEAVCIASVHDNSNAGCPATNEEYYQHNDNGNADFEYNGYTIDLIATMIVQPCQIYHIKLCIANGVDHALRSAVFIEAGSFTSGAPVSIEHETAFDNLHNDIIEGCENFYVFTRLDTSASALSHPLEVGLEIAGTATLGVDITPIPEIFYIDSGSISDTLFYTAFLDNELEGIEKVLISIANGCPCGDNGENPNSGGTSYDTIYIHDNSLIDAGIINNDTIFCYRQNTQTRLETFHNLNPHVVRYEWQTGNEADTLAYLDVRPRREKTFAVKIWDVCYSQDTIDYVNFSIYPPLSISATSVDTVVCPGESAKIDIKISGGNGGPYACTETDLGMVNPSFSAYPTKNKEIFYFEAFDRCPSPKVTDSVIIRVLPLPKINILTENNVFEGCQPLTVFFKDAYQYQQNNHDFYWSFGDKNYSEIKTPNHTFEEEGEYLINLRLTSPDNCVNEGQYTINVFPNPTARFFSNPESASTLNPEFYFEDVSFDKVYSYWNFNYGKDNLKNTLSKDSNPFFEYPKKAGKYTVQLVSENDYHCTDTIYGEVVVREESTFYTANTISLNSPNEKNRYFRPIGEGVDMNDYKLIIFNRWGNKIFETSNPNILWDGKDNGGKFVSVGVYPWIVNYTDGKGTKHKESGDITVIK